MTGMSSEMIYYEVLNDFFEAARPFRIFRRTPAGFNMNSHGFQPVVNE
jgi:hypothetical protein